MYENYALFIKSKYSMLSLALNTLNSYYCIILVVRSCLKTLSNEQIIRFTCCLNMVFNFTKPKLSPELFA